MHNPSDMLSCAPRPSCLPDVRPVPVCKPVAALQVWAAERSPALQDQITAAFSDTLCFSQRPQVWWHILNSRHLNCNAECSYYHTPVQGQ